jgi:TRAP-type C4-dicarboxylate transport system permease large subunit
MILLSVLLLVLAVFGAPLFAIIAASAMLGYHKEGIDLMAIAIEILGIANMPFLSAIPLFTFAGYLLSESNAPKRLVRLTGAILGWMPGGLALVSLAACAFFTAFTGASGVTIIALGAILYPALKQDGYPDNFNLGLVTTSGSLGLLFAPSLPLILYGVIAEVSIDNLFRAGVMPGMLMLLLLSGYSLWVNRHNRKPLKSFSWKEVGGALNEANLREIKFKELPGVMRESMLLVGGILIILGVSLASTNYMIDAGVPQALLGYITEFVSSQASFLFLLFIFLLILGAILDIFSAIVLVVPLILPIAAQYDVNAFHLGIVFLSAMQLGYLTPPVGLNLFIASYRFDRPIMNVYSATFPFLIILMLSVLIIMYWPGLSLWLIPD